MEQANSGRETDIYIFDECEVSSSNPNTVLLSTDTDKGQRLLSEILTRSESTYSSTTTISAEPNFKEVVMQIIKELGEEHPDIAIDPDMLNGVPHIKGIRLSVGNILEKLYLYGSIEEIKAIYGEDISEHQIKEAIAYAQDFLEKAYATSQS